MDPEAAREAGRALGGDRPLEDLVGEAVGPVEGRRAAGVAGEELAEVGPEPRIVADRGVGAFELVERGHERLGDVAAAERTVDAPAAGRIGLEEAGIDRCRPG
ncbi:MAG TPA: hypothetical protein VIU16_05230, partial [Gaiellaceae bacterium]